MASVSSDALPESFSKAFERLRATVNTEDARTFASTTMEDVWNTARRIERQLEAKRSLRNFNRIQKFLAGIEQYSKTVEVLCNQTPYLPFVWAPIKLFLDIAQANLYALDKLIDAYAMIGEVMPRFDRLSAAFKDDQDFQQVLGQFYEDILEFHRRAYKFFRRRAWKIVFESLWKTFNLRFESILEGLRKHRDLIDQEANAIDIVEAKAWRIKQLEEIQRGRVERAEDLDRMEGERLSRQIREAVAWLGANEEQEDTLAKLLRVHDSIDSHWSLTTPTILSWIEQGRENSYIWLNGKPGAGKSVICSKIIEHIQEKTEMVILFYFCHHFQTSKEPISEVLKCFATQLLVANPGLAPYILDTFANAGRKPTKKYLAEILEKLIASSRPIRLVVDGLDEWSQIDQEDLVKDLFRIRGSSPGACKILFSSRKTAHLTKLLQSQPTFRLDDYGENITSNIASFVQERLTRLRQTFASELVDELEGEILKRADGMFLWVRLILHTLEGLYYESDVRETIKTLPNDLDALYERILSRICGNGRDPNARRTVRILQWMLVAQRPLRQAELESGIILDDQVPQLTPATKARGNVLSLCFPLIEIDEESDGYAHFCHFTALEFLQKSNTYAVLQPPQAHVTVSLSCVLYLVSSLQFVDPSVAERDVRDQVVQGFHELLLYACDHWLDHLQALADTPTRLLAEQDTLSSLQQGLESLFHFHTELALSKGWTCGQQTDAFPSSRDDLWGSLGVSPSVCKLLNQGLTSKDQVSAMGSARPAQHIQSDGYRDPTLFTSVRARYKSITEDILNPQNPADALMREFRVSHSSGSYLCSYQGCPRASQGFSSAELRQQHEENHAPRFQCPNPACGFWKCSSEAALRKHTTKYHDAQDVSDVPNSIHRSVREVPQERSLFRLSTHMREHEKHETIYTCMPDGPVRYTEAGAVCYFCGASNPNEFHLATHSVSECYGQYAKRQRYTRKVNLQNHIKAVHNTSEDHASALATVWVDAIADLAFETSSCDFDHPVKVSNGIFQPRIRSPMQDNPTYESLARKGSSKETTPHYVPNIVNGVPAEPPSFQYRRNSSGHLVQVPTPALRPPQNQASQDYISQLFLLDEQNDRRLQRHQNPTGWQATISKKERIANVLQMSSTSDPGEAYLYESAEFRKAPDRDTYYAAIRRQQQQQQQQQTINNDMDYKYTQPLIQDQPNPPPTKTGGQSTTSSYWSIPEQTDMCKYLAHFGPNWQAIAQTMKTKTHTMIKNFYNHKVAEGGEFGRLLEETAQRAEMKIRNGQDTGPLPAQQQQHPQLDYLTRSFPDSPPFDYDAARANVSGHGSPAEHKEGANPLQPHAGIVRVDALGPPSAERPMPSPPAWLSFALQNLQQAYPNDLFEGTMRYTAVSTATELPIILRPNEPPPPDTKYMYYPAIKCLDCPGKLYTPGPGLGFSNFEVHLRSRIHRDKVERRFSEREGGVGGGGLEEQSENARQGLSPFAASAHETSSMPDAPDTLKGGTLASDAVRTGIMSRKSSHSNWSNRRPVTNTFENGMDLPELPRPSDLEIKENPEVPLIVNPTPANHSPSQLPAAEQQYILANRMFQTMSPEERNLVKNTIPPQQFQIMLAQGIDPIQTWCRDQAAKKIRDEREKRQQNAQRPTLPESPRPNYEAARTSIDRAHSKNLRLDLSQGSRHFDSFTPTTSMPDAPDTLTGGTLASGAVRTGEVSHDSSIWTPDHGYRRPMTNPLELRTGDRTLLKPSSPDIYPDILGLNKYPVVASSEMAHNFLPPAGIQQKTPYLSTYEDLGNYLADDQAAMMRSIAPSENLSINHHPGPWVPTREAIPFWPDDREDEKMI